ncbi:MAG: tetratricopeptide repeat protein [bacterium]|nr:tetratricopeptide repeat protein [bacterium]
MVGVISFLPLPAADIIINFILSSKEKIRQRMEEERSLNDWLYTIEKQPDNLNAYVSAGDIYFDRKNYEKAIEFYKKAYQIMEMPYVLQRIKTAEKELKIQKGIIWVCPECSFDNQGGVNNCKYCGYSRIDKDIFKEIRRNKKEIIKASTIIVLGPIAVILFWVLYIIMPPYLALIFTIIVIYLTIKYFTTY